MVRSADTMAKIAAEILGIPAGELKVSNFGKEAAAGVRIACHNRIMDPKVRATFSDKWSVMTDKQEEDFVISTLNLRTPDGQEFEMEVRPRKVCHNTLRFVGMTDEQMVVEAARSSQCEIWDDADFDRFRMLADKQSHKNVAGWAILKNPKV